MFSTTKGKIQKYLEQTTLQPLSAFDLLLSDYLDGSLKEAFLSIGIKKVQIHIDWFDHIRCIGIQGRYKAYYMDLQIYPNEFSISFDLDEPDEDSVFPLQSKEQAYRVLTDLIEKL